MGMLIPSDREMRLVALLVNGPRFGVELQRMYEKETRTEFPLGSLYVVLGRMIKNGFIRVARSVPQREGNRRRYFEITAKGRAVLDQPVAVYCAKWSTQNVSTR